MACGQAASVTPRKAAKMLSGFKNSEFIRFLQYTSDNATGIFTIGIISFLHPKAAMTINQCYADYSDNIL